MSNPYNDMDDVGKASGSSSGVWFEPVSNTEAGLHDGKLLKMTYKKSENPKHKGAMMFVAEFEVLASNVHTVGSTRTYVINMAHAPSKNNLKNFLIEVFVALGYKREEVEQWPALPGRNKADPNAPQTAWGDMCAWVLGPENPACKKGIILHVESNHTKINNDQDFTLQRFTYRDGVVTPMATKARASVASAPGAAPPAGQTAASAPATSGPPIPPAAA